MDSYFYALVLIFVKRPLALGDSGHEEHSWIDGTGWCGFLWNWCSDGSSC